MILANESIQRFQFGFEWGETFCLSSHLIFQNTIRLKSGDFQNCIFWPVCHPWLVVHRTENISAFNRSLIKTWDIRPSSQLSLSRQEFSSFFSLPAKEFLVISLMMGEGDLKLVLYYGCQRRKSFNSISLSRCFTNH